MKIVDERVVEREAPIGSFKVGSVFQDYADPRMFFMVINVESSKCLLNLETGLTCVFNENRRGILVKTHLYVNVYETRSL